MNSRIIDLFQLKSMFHNNVEHTITMVYDEYREEFITFAGRYTNDKELIIDAFQDAVVGLYQNLLEDNITSNLSSVKTYLFQIGKYKLFTILRGSNKMKFIENMEVEHTDYSEEMIPEEPTINLALKKAIDKLGDSCKRLLILFYYRKYSIDAIRHELNMKNENSVKSNKSRCVGQLRTIMKKTK